MTDSHQPDQQAAADSKPTTRQPKPATATDAACRSRFFQRTQRRYGQLLSLLPSGLPERADIVQLYAQLLTEYPDCGDALRITRNLIIHRLIALDCARADYPVSSITACLTELAAFCTQTALDYHAAALEARHGIPLNPDGTAASFWVMGMGKLGARELNASSDIDLICLHSSHGETQGDSSGRGRISNAEYFARLVRDMSKTIAEVTEHGFCFRVDLALRPNGKSGPPSMSLPALERYFLKHGREWERFAWLKSRVTAARPALTKSQGMQLREAVLPFVFRSRLDYRVFEALRGLHRKIRSQSSRKASQRSQQLHDVKLGRGGIREIEFTVQLLQVVRGGQFPELRHRATLKALDALTGAGLMPAETAAALGEAYCFLRRVEHRIQYLDDRQTHVLPTDADDLAWIARTLGFADTAAFQAELKRHQTIVSTEFDMLLGGADATQNELEDATEWETLTAGFADADTGGEHRLAQTLQRWHNSSTIQRLGESAQHRLQQVMEQMLLRLQTGRSDAATVTRLLDWLNTIARHEHYLALLLERPHVFDRLLRVLGAARWPAKYLVRQPGVIDELASPDILHQRFNAEHFARSLQIRRSVFSRTGEDTEETLLDVLRRAYHAEMFSILVRDLEDCISVEEVADDLTALAEAVIRTTLQWCWRFVSRKHRKQPQIAVIAYGKTGGKELGYGSDLDLVFAYEDDDPSAPEAYAALVRKFITWMSVQTGEGKLFDVDTALRPNGNSGLLITSFDSYANYQQQRGSNTAWTWEHQAMTRARCLVGTPVMQQRFDTIRTSVLTAKRDIDSLRREIADMRGKMYAAKQPRAGFFDIKHSHGGMIDVEFAVQFFVLAYSRQQPELIENKGNIALLERVEAAGLLPAGVGTAAAAAYRELRRVQHHARLDDRPGRVSRNSNANSSETSHSLQSCETAICQLWQAAGLALYTQHKESPA